MRINGTAKAETLVAGYYQDIVYGGDGNDLLSGFEDDDSLFGGPGDDFLYEVGTYGNGDDLLDGGDGIDALVAGINGYFGMSVDLTTGVYRRVYSSSGRIIDRNEVRSVEVVFGSDGADTIIGALSTVLIDAGVGADHVVWRGGAATLLGGPERDVVDGPDMLDLSAARGTVRYDETSGRGTIAGIPGMEFARFEGVIGSLTARNFLYGNDPVGTNDFTGGNAAGVLDSGRGDSRLAGLGGNDLPIGGDGRHDAYGGDGNDTIRIGVTGGTYRVLFGTADNIFGGAGDDRISVIAGDGRVVAGDGDDRISSLGGHDVYGGIGDDVFYGGYSLFGGAGHDVAVGRASGTAIEVYRGSNGNDSVSALGNTRAKIFGGNGEDRLSSDATTVIFGGAGQDKA